MRRNTNVKRFSIAILLAMTLLGMRGVAQAAPLQITDGWFRALPGNLPAGGYFTAYNGTGREISITGANSDACGMLMIHQSSRPCWTTGGQGQRTRRRHPALCARRLSPDVRQSHAQ